MNSSFEATGFIKHRMPSSPQIYAPPVPSLTQQHVHFNAAASFAACERLKLLA